jgi:hypothetical protein
MERGKKIWFSAISYRLWIPVSIEGWVVTFAFALGIFLIFKVNEVSDKVAFKLSVHWPMLLELAILAVGLLWVSRGHVKKRY